jgi:predicted homoserine dehydrogenase-like protein
MSLTALLAARVKEGSPVRTGLIGVGKFGSMFLSQLPGIPGLEVSTIADVDCAHAKNMCRTVGWSEELIANTRFVTDGISVCADERVEVIIEATGNPEAGIEHALTAIEAGKHVVMVTLEADVLAGPYLARKAQAANVIYSMAVGDQPALIAEMIDWARAAGFKVVAAGKGTKFLPSYHATTPDHVWTHYGLTSGEAQRAGMNARKFNSFIDGTKSAIEMAVVANACDLAVPANGLSFPPCGVEGLAHVLRPKAVGGVLEHEGMVEVISSLERDGHPVARDLRWGVYVVVKASNAYTSACFKQYGLITDSTGQYAAIYKPFHFIGMELSISVLNVALRNEPTGCAKEWRGDTVAVAKRLLRAGETLDGEGGYTVYGKLLPAARSFAENALPIGLAHRVKLLRDIPEGTIVSKTDVDLDEGALAVRVRREMEMQTFGRS